MNINNKDFENAWKEMYEKLSSWVDSIVINLPNLIIALFVFLTSLLLAKYVSKILQRILVNTSLQKSMRRVLGRLIAFFIVALAVFLILGILNLDKALNTILAGAGVAGLAVGLALQGALANTYSGIVLSYIKNLKIGDWIKSNNYEGEIIDVDFRAMTIKQVDNNLVYIPNKLVIENPIKNYSSTPKSKVILKNSVAYDSDLEKVKELTTKLIINNFEIPQKKEDVLFLYREFGDSAISYEMRFWIDSNSPLQVAKAKSKAIILIKNLYETENITIPFPIRTIEIGNKKNKFIS